MRPNKRELLWLGWGSFLLVVATVVELSVPPCDPYGGPCSKWRRMGARVSAEINATLYSISADDDGRSLWVGGDDHFVGHSADGGKTWTFQTLKRSPLGAPDADARVCNELPDGVAGDVIGIGFRGRDGVAMTRSARRFVTSDGGASWNEVPLAHAGTGWAPIIPLRAVHVSGADVKHVVACDGTVYAVSTDDVTPLPGDKALAYTESRGAPGEASEFVSARLLENGTVVFRTETEKIDSRPTTNTVPNAIFARHPKSVWLAFDGGLTARTADGGRVWLPPNRKTKADLNSVFFLRERRRGWAAGADGVVLRTTDGGASWSHLTPEPGFIMSRRWPTSLWYLWALVVALLMILRPLGERWPRNLRRRSRAIRHLLSSDKPARVDEQDTLGFGSVARAIVDLFANRDTSYPLAVAINGPWGSGKTSIARMVEERAKKRGMRVVWFDAWHHTSEDDLLAALFDTIRCNGIPSLGTWRGWVFRLEIALRNLPQLLPLLIVAAGAAIVFTYGGIATKIATIFATGILAAGADALKGLPDTNDLLSRLSRTIGLPDPDLRLGARHRFSAAVQQIVTALGPRSRLLIVIDDLDRCDPESMSQMIAAINFLTTSAECAFLIAMNRKKVEDIIGHDERRDRGEGFLDKIVDLEIEVPRYSQRQVFDAARPSRANTPAESGWSWAPAMLLTLLILCFAGYVALDQWTAINGWFTNEVEAAAEAPAPQPVAAEATAGIAEAQLVPPGNPATSAAAEMTPPTPPPPRSVLEQWWPSIVGGAVALAVLLILLFRQGTRDTWDTLELRRALRVWSPVVQNVRNTPRFIKRFVNRVRFAIAYQDARLEARRLARSAALAPREMIAAAAFRTAHGGDDPASVTGNPILTNALQNHHRLWGALDLTEAVRRYDTL